MGSPLQFEVRPFDGAGRRIFGRGDSRICRNAVTDYRYCMAAADIVIKGAREHNLRDVTVSLPRNKLICLTGVSGSGKSSLAFDTLYAEGQRRYVESLSTLCPAVSRADAEARRRSDLGPQPVDFDLAKDERAEPAQHRRHDHRDLRFPPRALRALRTRPLPAMRQADHGADARADHRPHRRAAGRDEVLAAWRRSSRRKKGNIATCSKTC